MKELSRVEIQVGGSGNCAARQWKIERFKESEETNDVIQSVINLVWDELSVSVPRASADAPRAASVEGLIEQVKAVVGAGIGPDLGGCADLAKPELSSQMPQSLLPCLIFTSRWDIWDSQF